MGTSDVAFLLTQRAVVKKQFLTVVVLKEFIKDRANFILKRQLWD